MNPPESVTLVFRSPAPSWESILAVAHYPETVTAAIRKARNKTCLLRFGNFSAAVLLGILLLWAGPRTGDPGVVFLVLLGIPLALYVLGNTKSAMKSLFDRIGGIPDRTADDVARFFYGQQDPAVSDPGGRYSCLCPHTTSRITLAEFISEWKTIPASLTDAIAIACRPGLNRSTAICESCGSSEELFVLKDVAMYQNIERRGVYAYLRCSYCGKSYCRKCLRESNWKPCTCGSHRDWAMPPGIFLLQQMPAIRMNHPSAGDHTGVKVSVQEEPGRPDLAFVTWSRSYTCSYMLPLEPGKKDDPRAAPREEPFIANVFIQNHAVRIDGHWKLIDPFPRIEVAAESVAT